MAGRVSRPIVKAFFGSRSIFTGGHVNPENTLHPNCAGDLPPLLGNQGMAYILVLTDRFRVSDILGKTVVIHGDPDDFHTQPAGNSGMKIACGMIRQA